VAELQSTNYNTRRDLLREPRTFSFNIAFALSAVTKFVVQSGASRAPRTYIRATDTFICSASHLYKASIYSARGGVLFAHVDAPTHAHARATHAPTRTGPFIRFSDIMNILMFHYIRNYTDVREPGIMKASL